MDINDALEFIRDLRDKSARARKERTCRDGTKGVSRRKMARLKDQLAALDQDAMYVYRSFVAAKVLDSLLTCMTTRVGAMEKEATDPVGIPLTDLDVEKRSLG